MSKVKIQGHSSGSGVLTIAAPNTNTDRTITLPDVTGTLLDSGSTLDATKLSGTLPAINGAALTNLPISGKLNLSGGAMTGAITTNSTFDGRDVAADGVLATNALPKAGGTLTGNIDGTTASFSGMTTAEGGLMTNGQVIFNEDSADLDFRVESNGNANMLFVDGGNNRVGIGTSTPAELLHVSGASATIEISASGDGATLVLNNLDGSVTGDWGIKNRNGNGVLGFSRSDGSGTDLMALTTTGNLGIGVTPAAWHSSYTALQIGNQGSLTQDVSKYLRLSNNIADTGSNVYISADEVSSLQLFDGKFVFYTAPSGSAGANVSLTNRMTILNNGKVGIGTGSPTRALTVASTGDTHINTTSSHANGYSMFVSENSSDANNSWGVGRWHDGRYVISHNSAATWSQTGDNERFVIDTSGKVGIGTTSPAKELHTMNASQSVANRVAYNGSYYTDYGYYNINTQSNNFVLKTTGTTRFTVRNDTGYLQVASGITFGTDTAAANALDDYEEGTFTATLTAHSSAPNTAVTATGNYTKIGRLVTVQIIFDNKNTTGASGYAKVTGLPFTVGSKESFGNFISYNAINYVNSTTSVGHAALMFVASNTQIHFYDMTDSGPWQRSHLVSGSGKYIYLSGTYTT